MARNWEALIEWLKVVEAKNNEEAKSATRPYLEGYSTGTASCAFRIRQWILDPDAGNELAAAPMSETNEVKE